MGELSLSRKALQEKASTAPYVDNKMGVQGQGQDLEAGVKGGKGEVSNILHGPASGSARAGLDSRSASATAKAQIAEKFAVVEALASISSIRREADKVPTTGV